MKEIVGEVKIQEGKSFGFVNNTFIHPTIVSKRKLTNGMQIKAFALKSFNSEKKQWGWKVV